MSNPTLVTIGFSHYCEKARWALERAGVPFDEDARVPFFHAIAARRHGGRRSVPVLRLEDRTLLDSADIVAWVAERAALLPPSPVAAAEAQAWAARFDRDVGPATRRLVYHSLLPDRAATAEVLSRGGGGWQSGAGRALVRPMTALMRRSMAIDDRGAARSAERLEAVAADVERALADGRAYLVGDRFTVADLCLASLMAPVVLPPAYAVRLPPLERMPGPLAALVERWRSRPIGRFVDRVYRDERARVVAAR